MDSKTTPQTEGKAAVELTQLVRHLAEDEAAALLIELQRELRAVGEEWRTKRDDPYAINYAVAIACFAQAEAIERTLKTASKWPNASAQAPDGPK